MIHFNVTILLLCHDFSIKAAVGNFEEREGLASNLKKYNFQIPPPPSLLHSCPASKVPPPEEADVRAIIHELHSTQLDIKRFTVTFTWLYLT